MSLIQRIWLITLFLLVLAFGSSIVISCLALRGHVEQTLRLKNADNTNALALTMTQLDKDPVTLELLLAAQFDTGHYRSISLVSNDDTFALTRQDIAPVAGVPGWFVSLVDLDVPAGVATVQEGWRQFGTLTVESHYQYAYRTLWDSTRNLLISFLLVGLLSLLMAYGIVRGIRRPLDAVIEQARRIGNRRFSVSQEPAIRELRQVVSAMNQLSRSVQQMLAQESGKLEQLQTRIHIDEPTGLSNRAHFLNRLDGLLQREDALANGMLAMVRVSRLAERNERLGYAQTNALIIAVSRSLQALEQDYPAAVTGRLNGSDFALLVAGDQQTQALADALARVLQALPDSPDFESGLPASLMPYGPGDTASSLLATLDAALATAEHQADRYVEVVNGTKPVQLYDSRDTWRAALVEALDSRTLRFERYPVVSPDNELLHEECPSRLYLAGEWRSAAVFIPWILRFDLGAAFDLQMIDTAITQAQNSAAPIAVNLSAQSLAQSGFNEALYSRLSARPQLADRLYLEWPAAGALANRHAFGALAKKLVACGYRIGLKHAGQELSRIAELHDLGLARVKLDAALIRDIDSQAQQQSYVRGICTLLHSVGVSVIAEGVQTRAEQDTLADLGLDGFTGRGIFHSE